MSHTVYPSIFYLGSQPLGSHCQDSSLRQYEYVMQTTIFLHIVPVGVLQNAAGCANRGTSNKATTISKAEMPSFADLVAASSI